MFDALQDTPRDFQFKLMDALNSLGQTMEIPPTECFDKVLCASDDENPDVKKTMYNWWRAFFEVLGKTSGNLPKDRDAEFTEKVDALMAEIMKSGDKEASEGNEVVLEDYEEADKAEEDEMNKDFDFAVQHIGEIANKVKDIVNFVNPYCEGNTTHCNSKEVDNTMKKKTTNERRDSEWVSMDDMIGMEVGESDNGEGFWNTIDDDDYLANRKEQTKEDRTFQVGDKVMWKDPEYDEWTDGWTVVSIGEEGFDVYDDTYTIKNDDGSEAEVLGCELRLSETMKEGGESEPLPPGEFLDKMLEDAEDTDDMFDVYDGSVMGDGSICLNVIVNKDDTDNEEVKAQFGDWGKQYGWKYESFSFSSDLVGDEGTETINVYFRPIEKKVDESDLENELDIGDDGWREIGQPVGEASVVVDANDVWDVLDLLSDETANKNLTDLINSHVRTEDEIMDAINSYVDVNWHGKVRKDDLNKVFTDWMYVIVDDLGLDVDKYREDGQFVDPKKPVALEGSEDEQKPDEVKDGEKKYKKDGETKTLVTGSDKENKKEMTNADAAAIMGGASATDMDAADMGLVSHKVADPYNNKQEVTEMTIEQEITDPWKLLDMLWGQGRDNLRELLESGLFDDEFIMQMIDDMEIHDLTAINDAFAFDFETILDMLGCDPHAWSQNLEIKRKGDEDSEED